MIRTGSDVKLKVFDAKNGEPKRKATAKKSTLNENSEHTTPQ